MLDQGDYGGVRVVARHRERRAQPCPQLWLYRAARQLSGAGERLRRSDDDLARPRQVDPLSIHNMLTRLPHTKAETY